MNDRVDVARWRAVVVATLTLAVLGPLGAADSAHARSCGSEVIFGSPRVAGDVKVQVRVIRGRVSCATARRVARDLFKYHDAGMGYWTFRNRKRGARVGGTFEELGSGARARRTAAKPRARAAEVHDCNHWAYYPNLRISSARNMSCRVARGEMRRYKRPIYRAFTTPYRRFRCVRVSGGRLGGQWRCTRGSRAFRFDFGD